MKEEHDTAIGASTGHDVDIESKGGSDRFDTTNTADVNHGQTRMFAPDGTQDLLHSQDQLQRGLKSRHIQFLALGGA